MTWCMHLLNAHGRYIKEHASSEMTNLRALQKSITSQVKPLFNVLPSNPNCFPSPL